MASETRLEEIQARLEAATPGPWELYATGRNVIAITKGRMRSGYRREIVHWSGFDCSNIDDPGQVRANAALIAHAPSDLAYLLDEIARLSRELEVARERERRLREAILAELYGVDGVAVTEISPDGVRRLWDALVQTEARKERRARQ